MNIQRVAQAIEQFQAALKVLHEEIPNVIADYDYGYEALMETSEDWRKNLVGGDEVDTLARQQVSAEFRKRGELEPPVNVFYPAVEERTRQIVAERWAEMLKGKPE